MHRMHDVCQITIKQVASRHPDRWVETSACSMEKSSDPLITAQSTDIVRPYRSRVSVCNNNLNSKMKAELRGLVEILKRGIRRWIIDNLRAASRPG